MDGWFTTAIVLVVIAIILVVLRVFSLQSYERTGDAEMRGLARVTVRAVVGVTVLAVISLIVASFTRVNTNQIGIINSFGRPVTAQPNGMHAKWPWQTKVEFDAARQFLRFEGNGNGRSEHDQKTFPCFNVRIVNNANGCVKGVVTWQMRARTAVEKDQAIELYRQYRTFERLNDNFMAQATQSALNATYADVNPLVPERNPSFTVLSDTAEVELHRIVGSQVEVLDFQITFIDYDDKTDTAIAAVQAQIAKTAEEKQKQLTNAEAARATAALGSTAQGPPPSEATLINKCLDIAQSQGKEPGYCFLRGGNALIQAR